MVDIPLGLGGHELYRYFLIEHITKRPYNPAVITIQVVGGELARGANECYSPIDAKQKRIFEEDPEACRRDLLLQRR